MDSNDSRTELAKQVGGVRTEAQDAEGVVSQPAQHVGLAGMIHKALEEADIHPEVSRARMLSALKAFALKMINGHALPASFEQLGIPDDPAAASHDTVVDVLCSLVRYIEIKGLPDDGCYEPMPDEELLNTKRIRFNVGLLVRAFAHQVMHGFCPATYWVERKVSPYERHAEQFTELMQRRIGAVVAQTEEDMRAKGQVITPAIHEAVCRKATDFFKQKESQLMDAAYCAVKDSFVPSEGLDAAGLMGVNCYKRPQMA